MSNEFEPVIVKPKDFLEKVKIILTEFGTDAIVGYPAMRVIDIPIMTFNAERCLVGVYVLAGIPYAFHYYDFSARAGIRDTLGKNGLAEGLVGHAVGYQSPRRVEELSDLGIKSFKIKPPWYSSGGKKLHMIAYPNRTVLFSLINMTFLTKQDSQP